MFFPKIQEKTAAHPVAQNGIHQAKDIAVWVGQGKARHAQTQVGLVAAASFNLDQRPFDCVGSRFPFQRFQGLPISGGLDQHIHNFFVGYIAGDRHNGVGRVVLLVHILADIFLLDVRHRLEGPTDITAHGLVRPHCLVDQQVHPVRRLVIGHPKFFLDHLALFLHLFRV